MYANIFVFLISCAVCAPCGLAQGNEPKQYHDVILKDLDGVRNRLKDTVDSSRVTVLTFWASYCEPCLKELIELNRLSGDLRDKGLSVVAINIDAWKDVIKARRYLQVHSIHVTVLYDELSIARMSYGVSAIPRLFVIGKDGVIRSEHSGFRDIREIEKELHEYLH